MHHNNASPPGKDTEILKVMPTCCGKKSSTKATGNNKYM